MWVGCQKKCTVDQVMKWNHNPMDGSLVKHATQDTTYFKFQEDDIIVYFVRTSYSCLSVFLEILLWIFQIIDTRSKLCYIHFGLYDVKWDILSSLLSLYIKRQTYARTCGLGFRKLKKGWLPKKKNKHVLSNKVYGWISRTTLGLNQGDRTTD